MFKKILDFATGGIGGKLTDKLVSLIPDKLSDTEKAQLEVAAIKATREHEMELVKLAHEGERIFAQRIQAMEGTGADLVQAGWIGRILMALRGAQRPVWGFGVLVIDFMVFSGRWDLASGEVGGVSLESAFWLINALVLGFLFGERSLRNVLPLIGDIRTKGQPSG